MRKSPSWLAGGLVLALLLIVLIGATLTLAGPAEQKAVARFGYDSLSVEEQTQAQNLALAQPALSKLFAAGGRAEVLLVERHDEDKSVYKQGQWARRADVFVYDYVTNTLYSALVNLDTRAVDAVASSQNVQLPLNSHEIALALKIALSEPATRAVIEAEYAKVPNAPKTFDPNTLRPSPFIFRADSLFGLNLGAAAKCGLERCVQLLLATENGYGLNIMPVVNLSTLSVNLSDLYTLQEDK